MNLRIYAPYGGLITDVAVNDKFQVVTTDPHKKRNVTVVPIILKPGEKITVRTKILSGRNQPDDPIFSVTPGIKPTPNNVAVASACKR